MSTASGESSEASRQVGNPPGPSVGADWCANPRHAALHDACNGAGLSSTAIGCFGGTRLEHIDGFVSDNAAGAIRLPVDGREVVLRGTTTPDGGLQITFAVTETYDIATADRLGMRTHCFGSRSGYSSIDSSHRPPLSLRGSLDADVSGSVGTGGASWENGR